MFYPKIMQPTHVKWEEIPPASASNSYLTNGHTNGTLTNRDATLGPATSSTAVPSDTIFPPIPPVVARNFLITDLSYEAPPHANLGIPGPDGDVEDLGPNGLSTIPSDVLSELPDGCRTAFEQARKAETNWKAKWGTEGTDGARGELRIGFNGFPV